MRKAPALLALTVAAGALVACTQEKKAEAENEVHGVDVVRHELNSHNGRILFVQKGCVICHSVNGVGGKAAPALDAQIGAPPIDPLDFAARMWLGAPAMIELQSVELGYTISLTADDIASLSAFAGDVEEQKQFTIEEVPEMIRDSMLDERFWEMEDWSDFFRKGQEGYEPEGAPPDAGSDDASGEEPKGDPQ